MDTTTEMFTESSDIRMKTSESHGVKGPINDLKDCFGLKILKRVLKYLFEE